MATSYDDFLNSKRAAFRPVGFEPGPINGKLVEVQRATVLRALRCGRHALFLDTGMGKSPIQLEWSRHVAAHTEKPVLILAPLAVAPQMVREGAKFDVPVKRVRSQSECDPHGVHITNYEMLRHFDPDAFGGLSADESGILKSYTGKTKQAVIKFAEAIPYRLACTATPAPNDHMELGNHAEFLGVMRSGEMLMRWFLNDPAHAGEYRLKGHAVADFWRWVSTWAVAFSKPSDLGYSDDGFELPPLQIVEHVVEVDLTSDRDDGMLFRMPSMSATTMNAELRRTLDARVAKAVELVATRPDEPWVVWCHLNDEADAVTAAIPGAVNVRGSDQLEVKERHLEAFAAGEVRVLVTKPSIAGFGLNWQHCRNPVVVGLNYSHEELYQLIRRFHRRGQKQSVTAHLILAETEGPVLKSLIRKEAQHEEMKMRMVRAVKETGLTSRGERRGLTETERDTASGASWTIHLGDSCRVIREIADDSVHLTVSSPPFESLYTYSDKLADMGNSADSGEFFEHFRFLVPELFRITVPGRLCCIHCKDLPLYKGRDGAAGLSDFPGRIVRAFEEGGWTFHSRVTIWKDPVTEMQRTKNHGLLHKIVCQDSSSSRQGMADYVLVFRAWKGDGPFPDPVCRPELGPGCRFDSYVGAEPPTLIDVGRDNSIAVWQRYASPVWFDIDPMKVLPFRASRDGEDGKHICPLQLQVIERCIDLWTNPGDVVYDPFTGIGSTPYQAVKQGRYGLGSELKPAYFRVAVANVEQIERDIARPMLDMMAGATT